LNTLYGRKNSEAKTLREDIFNRNRRPGAIGAGLNFQGSMPAGKFATLVSPSNSNFRRANRSSIAPSQSNPFITMNPEPPQEPMSAALRRNASVMKNGSFAGENLVLP
jgi:hypothetical protein